MSIDAKLIAAGASGAAAFDPTTTTQTFEYLDDFHDYTLTNSGPLHMSWFASGSAGNAKVDPSTSNLNRIGIIQYQSGTTAAGAITSASTVMDVQLGGATITYACSVSLSAAPSVGEDFAVRLGLINTFPGLGQHGVLFTADRTLNTTNWVAVTRQASTNTVTDTGIALATGYNNFRFVITAGTNVLFYINGSLVATHSTNIPTANGQAIGPLLQIQKVAGVASQTFNADWLYYKYTLGSARGTF